MRAIFLGMGAFVVAFVVGLAGMQLSKIGSTPATIGSVVWMLSPVVGLAAAMIVPLRNRGKRKRAVRDRAARVQRGKEALATGFMRTPAGQREVRRAGARGRRAA